MGRLFARFAAVVVSDVRRAAYYAAMLCFGVLALPVVAFATDPVALPNTGVDLGGTVDAMVTGLSPAIQKIVLAFAAYLLIRFGMKWFRRTT